MSSKFYRLDNECILIITDINYFMYRYDEIDNWCYNTFGYHPREGIVLTFVSESDMMFFMLKFT